MSSIVICNDASMKFFNALPAQVRGALMVSLRYIDERVGLVAPGRVVTSGFRSPVYSKSIGSSPNSKHGYGCAIDYRLGTIDPVKIADIPGLKVVFEKTCIHVERVD